LKLMTWSPFEEQHLSSHVPPRGHAGGTRETSSSGFPVRHSSGVCATGLWRTLPPGLPNRDQLVPPRDGNPRRRDL